MSLELTETEHLSVGASEGEFVRKLQRHGFTVLLDDFGTGWSSLQYLLSLPVDGVKIDRIMAVALGTRTGDALIRAITGIARDLDLITVIEGIETKAQTHRASASGCQLGQGYLWSKPKPAAQFTTFDAHHTQTQDT